MVSVSAETVLNTYFIIFILSGWADVHGKDSVENKAWKMEVQPGAQDYFIWMNDQ